MKTEKPNGCADTRSVPTVPKKRIIGVILAGGRSTRMGRDKATLPYGDGRLIDHVAARLTEAIESQCAGGRAEILVSGSVEGFRCVADREPGLGPLGGIASVLDYLWPDSRLELSGTGLLVVAVDMPSLPAKSMAALIRFWTERASTGDGAAFAGHELPVLLAVSTNVRGAVEARCGESATPRLRSIRALTNQLCISTLDAGCHAEREFLNANTPGDWLRLMP